VGVEPLRGIQHLFLNDPGQAPRLIVPSHVPVVQLPPAVVQVSLVEVVGGVVVDDGLRGMQHLLLKPPEHTFLLIVPVQNPVVHDPPAVVQRSSEGVVVEGLVVVGTPRGIQHLFLDDPGQAPRLIVPSHVPVVQLPPAVVQVSLAGVVGVVPGLVSVPGLVGVDVIQHLFLNDPGHKRLLVVPLHLPVVHVPPAVVQASVPLVGGVVGPVAEVSGVVVEALLDTQHLTDLPPLHKLL
jgi:hypothetical protein